MRNHLVTSKQPLLNIDGTLREPGWSKSLVQTYSRKDIKKRITRIKEWDYYSVISNKNNIAVCFTVSDLGYIELDSVSFLDFSVPREHTQGNILPFPLGRLHMPNDSSFGDVKTYNSKLGIEFLVRDGKRVIRCDFPEFDGGKGLKANITLESLNDDTMVIATPFKTDKKAFYYMVENCMNFHLKQISAHLTGAEGFGPMTMFGIGVQARVILTVIALALISVTASVTHLPQAKMLFFMTVWHIKLMMLSLISVIILLIRGLLHRQTADLK